MAKPYEGSDSRRNAGVSQAIESIFSELLLLGRREGKERYATLRVSGRAGRLSTANMTNYCNEVTDAIERASFSSVELGICRCKEQA